MPAAAAIPIVAGAGMVAGAGASAYGAHKQAQQAKRQYNDTRTRVDANMMNGPTSYEQMLNAMLGKGSSAFNPQSYSGAMIDPNSAGMNMGQDALMQMMRADPYKAAQGSIDAMAPLDQRQLANSSAALQSGMGSLGARFGSAYMSRQNDLSLQMGQQVGARNAGLLQTGYENAMNRNMQGALGMNDFLSRIGLANQASANQASQFNIGSAQQALQARLAAMQAGFGMQMGRASNNNQLIGLLAGQAVPTNGWSSFGQGLTSMSGTAMMLPMLMSMMKGGGGNWSQGT